MSKIKINIFIKNAETNYEYETTGIINDNTIKYIEEDNTKTTYNYDNNHLTRTNKDLQMDIIFDLNKETEGIIRIENINKSIPLRVKTNKIERKKNNILIEYMIDNDQFIYRIEELL